MERNRKYMNAVRSGNINTVRRFLNEGVKVNEQWKYDENALTAAAFGGHHYIVELLISKGANIHKKDKRNMNPLMWASVGGNIKTVTALLKAGANINSKSKNGRTPLDFSIIHGRQGVASLLLERGANIPKNLNTLEQKSYMSKNAIKIRELVRKKQKERAARNLAMRQQLAGVMVQEGNRTVKGLPASVLNLIRKMMRKQS